LLDEPSSSLDREGEERFWRSLEQQLKPNDILVVSTHRPLMAAQSANRVLVMQRGRIIRDGSPDSVVPNLMRQGATSRPAQSGNADVV
jgi:ATP-binding cassette subfamily C protein LapB